MHVHFPTREILVRSLSRVRAFAIRLLQAGDRSKMLEVKFHSVEQLNKHQDIAALGL